MTHRSRIALLVIWVLALALLGAWVERSTDTWLIPPGPAFSDPGYGPGSDWDCQYAYAQRGALAVAGGASFGWEPLIDFGVPHLGNPESFGQHPAFVAGSDPVDTRPGLRALVGFALVLFAAGMAWLAHVCGAHWLLGLAAAFVLPTTAEWEGRLSQGHLMFLGIAAWPAVLAGTLAGLRSAAEGETLKATLLAALSGAALGLAALGGGHYPVVFAGLLVPLLTLAWAANEQSLLWIPAFLPGLLALDTPPWMRRTYVLGLALLLARSVWTRRDRLRAALPVAAGLLIGGLATGAGKLLSSAWVATATGTLSRSGWYPPDAERGSFVELFVRGEAAVEGPLYLGYIGWAVAVLGLGYLVTRRDAAQRALGVAAVVVFLLGLATGGELQPWELVRGLPGFARVDYPQRLQWIVLVIAPLGAAHAVAWGLKRLPRSDGHMVGALAALLVAAASLGWSWGHVPPRVDSPPEATSEAEPGGSVAGIASEGALLSGAARDGLIRPDALCGLGLEPLEPRPADLVSSGEATVRVEDGVWRVAGAAGSRVELAQRAWPGWTCEGADVLGAEPSELLALELTGSEAECRWRDPTLPFGLGLQGLALLVLGGVGVRRRRG